jgi:hypothetical protein
MVPTSSPWCGIWPRADDGSTFVTVVPRLALSPTGHGERDQKENDPNATHDVRNHGYRTGEIARVGPDQTHDRSHDEHGDRYGEPIEDASGTDDGILASGALGRERRRPAEQLADPVPRLPRRNALAGLEFPVLRNAHTESPRRLPDRPALPEMCRNPTSRRTATSKSIILGASVRPWEERWPVDWARTSTT